MNIIHDISKTITKVNKYSKHDVLISSYPEFMQKLRQRTLPEFQGELRYPTYSRVHRTICSVRSRNKRKNFKLEQVITRRLEPLMVIAQYAGIPISNGIVVKLWKLLFKAQPHDTMGGSVTDNVALDINERYKQAFEIANGLENYIKKRLAQRLSLSDHDVLVFNTDPYSFKGRKVVEIISSSSNVKFPTQNKAVIVDCKEVKSRPHIMQLTPNGYEFKDESGYFKLKVSLYIEMKGLGYQVIHFENSESVVPKLRLRLQKGSSIANKEATVNYLDGKFNLVTKNKTFTDFISVYDQANDGDTYDFSPLKNDHEMRLPWQGKIQVAKAKDIETLQLSGSWSVPYDLEDRTNSQNAKKVAVNFQLTLTIFANSPVISAKLIVDNQALSHRLRLRLKTGLETENVHAQIQGGFRKTTNEKIADNWNDEFVEKPVNIYIFDRCVGMNNSKVGLYFLGKGQKEYEKKDDSLFITLMATTGQLGKPNLLWRPGRASGDTTSVGHVMMPTPMAQELGVNEFNFGLYVPSGSQLKEEKLSQVISKWYSPSVSYQMQKHNLFVNRLDNKLWDVGFVQNLPQLKKTENWLNINSDIEVSALYLSYTIKKHLVLRLSNMTNTEKDVSYLKDKILLKLMA